MEDEVHIKTGLVGQVPMAANEPGSFMLTTHPGVMPIPNRLQTARAREQMVKMCSSVSRTSWQNPQFDSSRPPNVFVEEIRPGVRRP